MINPKKVGKASLALGLSVLILGSNIANAESYKLVKPVNVYLTAYDAKYKTNPVTTFSAGTYNIYRRYDGQINISKTSSPGGWINPLEASASTDTGSSQTTTQSQTGVKTYKSTAIVNVRTGPSTNYKILGQIPLGTTVSGSVSGNWIKITYKGQTAYTSAAYYTEVKSTSESTQVYKNYRATDAVYIRSGKGTNYSKLGMNYPDTVINAVKEGDWLKFTYKGKTAYTAAAYYKEQASSTSPTLINTRTYISTDSVYIRSGKGTNYSKLGVNYKGTAIEGVIEGNWIKFIYDGKISYTWAAFYKDKATGEIVNPAETTKPTLTNARTYISTDSVYIRSGKGTNYSKLGVNHKGTAIEGVIEGNWIKFVYNGRYAYTAAVYYKEESAKADENISKDEPLNQKEASYLAEYAVNVRRDPSVDSEKVGLIAKGTVIKGVKEGDWIRFTYNNRQAYTVAEYYTPLSIPETGSTIVSPRQAFINRIGPTARELAGPNDLYASVMIAQSALETGFGTSWLSSSDINNLFGVKGHYNGEYVVMDAFEYDGDDKYYEYSHFKKYPSIKESMLDYVDLLTGGHDSSRWNYKYYFGVRKSQTNSYEDATRYLTGRYATAPNYYSALNQIIEAYNLTQYDK
ncbi:MAG: SH3 domain-containing protein [Tissierellia bacterium]|nr:SH3 domain-containing protein [Tissierellia bacterium]